MTVTAEMKQGLARYVKFFETLSPDSLKELEAHYTPNARFKDPFNDVTGTERIRPVFEDMFRTIGIPQSHVTDTAWSETSNDTAFLRWTFTYRIRGRGAPKTVEGMSALIIAADGRVGSHIDYWDAAQGLYEHLPVIGAALRWIRKRIEV